MKNMNKIKKKALLVTFLTAAFFLPFFTFGETAELFFEPAEIEKRIDEKFIAEVRVDTKGECINAAEVHLLYPRFILQAEEFLSNRSDFTLWPESPEIHDDIGFVTFTGGIPGGYCPEDGESVLLGEILFKVGHTHREVSGEARFWGGSRIMLNDGLATPLDYTRKRARFTVIPEVAEDPEDPLLKRFLEDSEAPEIFNLQLNRDPGIFGGKYFLIFNARDEGSGIDYFKISEQKRIGFITAESEKWERWERAESPYLLQDQTRNSVIKVKAVDRAGNETVKTIHPPVSWRDVAPWVIVILVALFVNWRIKRNKEEIDENKIK